MLPTNEKRLCFLWVPYYKKKRHFHFSASRAFQLLYTVKSFDLTKLDRLACADCTMKDSTRSTPLEANSQAKFGAHKYGRNKRKLFPTALYCSYCWGKCLQMLRTFNHLILIFTKYISLSSCGAYFLYFFTSTFLYNYKLQIR